MIKLIPKIHLRDKASYIENKIIAVPCYELLAKKKSNRGLFAQEYFKKKEIILSSVMPDENEFDYLDYLEIVDIHDFTLMTPDFPLYDDFTEQQKDFYLNMFYEDLELFSQFIQDNKYPVKKIIGLLKGTNEFEYSQSFTLIKQKFDCDKFMIYLSGSIRSNPRYFNALEFLQRVFPNGFKDKLILYGFNKKSVPFLAEIQKEYNIFAIISEKYHADSIYRSNQHYKRETRMVKSWEKYKKLFQEGQIS